MPESNSLRIAVISDLHAIDDVNGGVGNSNIRVSDAGDPTHNPLDALLALVRAKDLEADLLVCPGDLCDKSDPGGLTWAWKQLDDIAKALGAEALATTGNHDVDSRLAHKKTDTYGALLDLDRFPIDSYSLANEYFARGIAVHESKKARVILLDSCYLHRERKPKQLERGFLTERVLDRVEEIASQPPSHDNAINIVVCHHQPLRWTEFGGGSNKGEMRGGERLVRILERSCVDGWMLLHGHCHVPALDYLGQTSSGPVRFSAGSAGVALPATVHTSSLSSHPYWSGDIYLRNQFYILEFADPGAVPGVGVAGQFRAWDWLNGWQPAKRESMIPGEGGFGFRASGIALADWITGIGGRDLTWTDLINKDSRLAHLAPCDMNMLVMTLRRRGHGVLQDENGRIAEVSLL
jgi:3',5'-cyclic AMP phosphodiesterase CpdA